MDPADSILNGTIPIQDTQSLNSLLCQLEKMPLSSIGKVFKRVVMSPLFWAGAITGAGVLACKVVMQTERVQNQPLLQLVSSVALMILNAAAGHLSKNFNYECTLGLTMIQNMMGQGERWQWWSEIEEGVILGALPMQNKGHMEQLKAECDVKAVLSLNEDFEFLPSLFGVPVTERDWANEGIGFRNFPSEDFKPVSFLNLNKSVDYIHECKERGETVYVHCKSGVSRSASVMVCYLIKYKDMNPQQAMDFVLQKRPHIILNREDEMAIERFAQLNTLEPTGS